MTLAEAVFWGREALKENSDTVQLDAELLLAEALGTSRVYLITEAERVLTKTEQNRYQESLARRKQGEPIAYIVGHKEFWSLDLQVSPATLIPRPETELVVELLLHLVPKDKGFKRVADLGTGCGAIALALAYERPLWEIYATDLSPAALEIAASNARSLELKNVQFAQGCWCEALPAYLFDAIVSNPPYLSESEWLACSKELIFEPSSALVSGKEGLEEITKIAKGAKNYLREEGYLLLEHGSTQATGVRTILENEGYLKIVSYEDLAGRARVTMGCRS